jgi:hypothetical protein
MPPWNNAGQFVDFVIILAIGVECKLFWLFRIEDLYDESAP